MTTKLKFALVALLVCIFAFAVVGCKSADKADDSKKESVSASQSSSEKASESSSTHTHSYKETIDKPATCLEDGSKTLTCSCGDTKKETIPASGHVWNAGEVTTPATCTTPGEKTFTCKNSGCSETKKESINTANHSLDAGEVTTPATCTTAGVKTFKCTNEGCSHTETSVIDALKHEWVDGQITLQPDCKTETAGKMEQTCSRSGCGETQEVAVPFKHTYDANNVCTVCGAEKPAAILNVSELTIGDITATVEVNEVFTIMTDEAKNKFTVDANEKWNEDATVKFENRLKTNGGSKFENKRRLIQINAASAGDIVIYALSSTASDSTRTITIYDASGNAVGAPQTVAGQGVSEGVGMPIKISPINFSIPKFGNYYVGVSAGINFYCIEFKGNGQGMPGPNEAFTILANDLTVETVTAEKKVTDTLTLLGASDKAITIEADPNGLMFGTQAITQRIKLGGTGTPSKCALKLTINGAGTLKIMAASTGDTARTLNVECGATLGTADAPIKGSVPAVSEIQISGAGDCTIYSTGKGIYIYAVEFVPAN